MDILFIILWFGCSLAVWVVFHKLFRVVYFELFNGCLKEFITSGIIGAVLAGIIIRFWFVAVIVIFLFLFSLSKK